MRPTTCPACEHVPDPAGGAKPVCPRCGAAPRLRGWPRLALIATGAGVLLFGTVAALASFALFGCLRYRRR
jgi:hypothetical protein